MLIGKVKINENLILAPMADVTNPAFRILCKKYGASLTYSEMVSSDAILHGNIKSMTTNFKCNIEKPFAFQIFGNNVSNISNAAIVIEDIYAPEIIDLNLGCPAHVLVKDGSGSALLHFPDKVRDIVTAVHQKIDTPITVKMRVLPDIDKTLKIAKIIEDSGASALTVHGRTQLQQYAGKADHNYAKYIKSKLSIPVIVNGDIVDGISAKSVLEYTGCDAAMIGRAAMGNPYIFKEIDHFLKTGKQLEIDLSLQRIKDFNNYIKLLKLYDLYTYINLRIQACWFTKGLKNGRYLRELISKASSKEEIVKLMNSYTYE